MLKVEPLEVERDVVVVVEGDASPLLEPASEVEQDVSPLLFVEVELDVVEPASEVEQDASPLLEPVVAEVETEEVLVSHLQSP